MLLVNMKTYGGKNGVQDDRDHSASVLYKRVNVLAISFVVSLIAPGFEPIAKIPMYLVPCRRDVAREDCGRQPLIT